MASASSVVKNNFEISAVTRNQKKCPMCSSVTAVALPAINDLNEVELFFSRYPGGAQSFAFEVQVLAFSAVMHRQPPKEGEALDIFADLDWMAKSHIFEWMIQKSTAATSLSCYFNCQSQLKDLPSAASTFIHAHQRQGFSKTIDVTREQKRQISTELSAAQAAKEKANPLPEGSVYGAYHVQAFEIDRVVARQFTTVYNVAFTNAIHHLQGSWQKISTFFEGYHNFLSADLRNLVLQYTYDPYEGDHYSTYLADMRYWSQKRTDSIRPMVEERLFDKATEANKRVWSARLNELILFETHSTMREVMSGNGPSDTWKIGELDDVFDEDWMEIREGEIANFIRFTLNPKLPLDDINWNIL